MRTRSILNVALAAAIAGFIAALAFGAHAQSTSQVVSSCGASSFNAGSFQYNQMDPTGKPCGASSSGTVTANVTGFRPTAYGTPIAVTTGGVTGTLPAGAEVVAFDVGPADVYCELGASSTTSGVLIKAGSWFPFAINGDTQLTCITASGTATVNTAGGTGLPSGTGAGGAVTQGTTPWLIATNPSSASSIAITSVASASAENNHVLKNSAGNLYSVYATNLTGTSGFLVVLNATTAPADGAITPLACVPLPANGAGSVSYEPGPPAAFSTGIVAVVTSAVSCFTKTTGVVTAFFSGNVQ